MRQAAQVGQNRLTLETSDILPAAFDIPTVASVGAEFCGFARLCRRKLGFLTDMRSTTIRYNHVEGSVPRATIDDFKAKARFPRG